MIKIYRTLYGKMEDIKRYRKVIATTSNGDYEESKIKILEIEQKKRILIEKYTEKIKVLNEESLSLKQDVSLFDRVSSMVWNIIREMPNQNIDIFYIKTIIYRLHGYRIEEIKPIIIELMKKDEHLKIVAPYYVRYSIGELQEIHACESYIFNEFKSTKYVAEYLNISTTKLKNLRIFFLEEGYYIEEFKYSEKDIFLLESFRLESLKNHSKTYKEIIAELVLTGEEKEKRLRYLNEKIKWSLKKTGNFRGYEFNYNKRTFNLLIYMFEILLREMPDKIHELQKNRHFPNQVIFKRNYKRPPKNLYACSNNFYIEKYEKPIVYKNIIKYLLIELDIPFEELYPIITLPDNEVLSSNENKSDEIEFIFMMNNEEDDLI